MSQVPAPTPLGTVAYDSTAVVIWLPADKSDPSRPAKCGDVLQFGFAGPGTVQQAVMICSPKTTGTAPSPFYAKNSPTTLSAAGSDSNFDYFTTPAIIPAAENGTWSFSIAFMTQDPPPLSIVDLDVHTAPPASAFYFLPDPELAVGPGTGQDGNP